MDERIRKYQRWLTSGGKQPELVLSNEVLQQPDKFKVEEVLMALARGPKCFDFDLYVAHNPDVAAGTAKLGRWAAACCCCCCCCCCCWAAVAGDAKWGQGELSLICVGSVGARVSYP